MVALEALACGTPVLASKSLHSLPESVSRPEEETVSAWVDSIEHSIQSELESGDSLKQHTLQSINSDLLFTYQGLIEPDS